MLALHLVQNASVYINVLMLQRVLAEEAWDNRLHIYDNHILSRRNAYAGVREKCPWTSTASQRRRATVTSGHSRSVRLALLRRTMM